MIHCNVDFHASGACSSATSAHASAHQNSQDHQVVQLKQSTDRGHLSDVDPAFQAMLAAHCKRGVEGRARFWRWCCRQSHLKCVHLELLVIAGLSHEHSQALGQRSLDALLLCVDEALHQASGPTPGFITSLQGSNSYISKQAQMCLSDDA